MPAQHAVPLTPYSQTNDVGLIPYDSCKSTCLQPVKKHHSASNTGLFVKLLLVARVKENLNGLEVYPYIYVVTRQIPVCSLPRIANVYHLAIYVAQAPELS